jgi:hypothetical protein
MDMFSYIIQFSVGKIVKLGYVGRILKTRKIGDGTAKKVYMYINIYIRIYIYMYLCMYVHRYVCLCIYVYMFTYVYIHTCVHVYIY